MSPLGGGSRSGNAGTAPPGRERASRVAGVRTLRCRPASPGLPPAAGSNRKKRATAAFCTHREVKPYAGTAGFDADAWCPECQYYKLRRAPKKRTPNDDYGY